MNENTASTPVRLFRWVTIPRHDDRPYLDRMRLLDTRLFGIYLHRFLSSDDVCLHDHPWPFISIILRGGYSEQTPFGTIKNPDSSNAEVETKWYPPLSVLFRPATWTHRIVIDSRRPPISLVIRGKRARMWGFYTLRGWVPWRQYAKKDQCG